MRSNRRLHPFWIVLILGGLLGAVAVRAEIRPSSEVLVPYFEVSLEDTKTVDATTLFAVSNWAPMPVEVIIQVHTNWGIPVLTVTHWIDPQAVFTVNLRDWLILGKLPEKTLSPKELAHLQAALSGQKSPQDNLYYSTPLEPGVATGYVTIEKSGYEHRNSLWGDYFIVNSAEKYAEGETLVNIDKSAECLPDCERHGVRFMAGGKLSQHSEIMIWTPVHGHPSPTPEIADLDSVDTTVTVYDETGKVIDERHLRLLPVQWIEAEKLGLSQPFGWFDIQTGTESFVTAHFGAEERFHLGLHSYCLPEENGGNVVGGPAISLEKLVNGTDADSPPGPSIPVGGAVHWDYLVENVGGVHLTGVTVTDDQAGLVVSCPQTELAPGESMTCTADGTAVACQHYNLATATGLSPDDVTVDDEDGAYYMGLENAAIDLEKLVNGQDADTPATAVSIPYGAQVAWTYPVTNTGAVRLSGVAVHDDAGFVVTCPKTALDPGESMTCTAGGIAEAGLRINVGRVTGTPSCGPPVTDMDLGHYYGEVHAGIQLIKSTNDQDANVPPGPYINVGSPVQWTYQVTNAGDVRLTNVTVSDDRDVSCPKTVLEPGESMTCTASGTAVAGQYANIGTATGTPPVGPVVTDTDPSHYYGQRPAILLEKLTNGQDADTPTGPVIQVGDSVLWTYVVTNTGDVKLTQVTVTDDRGVTVTCPKTELAAGESMTCTASGTATAGQYTNTGTATGTPPAGCPPVTDTDPSHYLGVVPGLDIEKLTNGQDADTEPGPVLIVGSTVQWAYVVTNTGGVTLTAVTVTDDQGVAVSCPKTTLAPGESMTCTAEGKAKAGQYHNTATATGMPPTGAAVTDTDPSHYFGQAAVIALEKLVNGEDADTPPGPTIKIGDPVLWTYVVTNTGNVALTNVLVSDDHVTNVTCPKTTLAIGESMTCTANGTAVQGLHTNVGTARGTPLVGPDVMDTAPANYTGKTCLEGCTPGYWKNHSSSWPATGYSTSQRVDSVFTNVNTYYPSLGNDTLWQALAYGGGSGNQGAAEILLRAAVAALLNSAHPNVDYPRTTAQVISSVNAALLQNRDAMLALAAELDADNNLGCPLH